MSVVGLVVAGGAGERMSRSGSPLPKPLVLVRGVPLLERSVFALLRAGIAEIHIAVSAQADAIVRFARSRCQPMAAAVGATLSVMVEHQPLGSIGPAAFLKDRGPVLVVNADNMTSLDLRAILAAHLTSGAAMTLAVHDQPFPLPFGQVTLESSQVIAYREKPTLGVTICSAISVLSRATVAAMEPGERIGLPGLVNTLLRSGAEIRAFRHHAPWIDVNDLAAVEEAEALVAKHAAEFELWDGQPDHERVAVIFFGHRGVMLEQNEDETWCLPTAGMTVDENPLPAVMRIAEERFGKPATLPTPLAVFDDIDTIRGGVTRTRVFSLEMLDDAWAGVGRWIRPEDVAGLRHAAPFLHRSLAAWAKRQIP